MIRQPERLTSRHLGCDAKAEGSLKKMFVTRILQAENGLIAHKL